MQTVDPCLYVHQHQSWRRSEREESAFTDFLEHTCSDLCAAIFFCIVMLLLITPFLFFDRDGKCRMTYELLSSCNKGCPSSLVTVNSDGLVRSSGLSGTAFVLVTAHEHSSFNQTAVFQVEVRQSLPIFVAVVL